MEGLNRTPIGFACDFRSIPKAGAECYQSIWSQGGECRTCYVEGCYRRGMTQSQVDADNAKLVRQVHSGLGGRDSGAV